MSFTRQLLHVVFSTKGRTMSLSRGIREKLLPYMIGIAANLDSPVIIVDGVEDHLHFLIDLHANLGIAEFVGKLKANTSRWWNQSHPVDRLAWQRGYGAFSVSPSKLDSVVEYIRNQEAHHKRQSFEDELRALLRRHGIEFEERYLLD